MSENFRANVLNCFCLGTRTKCLWLAGIRRDVVLSATQHMYSTYFIRTLFRNEFNVKFLEENLQLQNIPPV